MTGTPDDETSIGRRTYLAVVAGAGATALAGCSGGGGGDGGGGDGGGSDGGGSGDGGGGNNSDGGGGGVGDEAKSTVDDHLSKTSNYDGSIEDMTGKSEVTVRVGAQGNGGHFAFDPPAIHVDSGTTVVWEWTGKGGSHNVKDTDGNFESELQQNGSFEHKFDSSGVYTYVCTPHKMQGMKGAVVVG